MKKQRNQKNQRESEHFSILHEMIDPLIPLFHLILQESLFAQMTLLTYMEGQNPFASTHPFPYSPCTFVMPDASGAGAHFS